MINELNEQPVDQVEEGKDFLPSSNVILILGILSIVGFWLYGFPGLVSGIFAIKLSNKALKFQNLPEAVYKESSLRIIKVGRILGIVGASLSGLYVLLLLIIWFI